MTISMQPGGIVIGGRRVPTDDDRDKERAAIQLDETRFGPEAIAGLDWAKAPMVEHWKA